MESRNDVPIGGQNNGRTPLWDHISQTPQKKGLLMSFRASVSINDVIER